MSEPDKITMKLFTEREIIILLVGGVIGYCFCFVVEIGKILRSDEPIDQPESRREKDPADWWKEAE